MIKKKSRGGDGMHSEEMKEILAYYRAQGAPQDQQMLIALLREMQDLQGGVLAQGMLQEIAQAYGVRETMLQALIRRVPDLRMDTAPHRLEICGTCRAGAQLRDFVERTYGVKSGADSESGGFVYRVTPCMKNCKNGPSIKWDGVLYSRADEKLLRGLIGK